jgi:hypothetical protein
MATIDRIDPGFSAWTPSAAGLAAEEDEYVGRHRRPNGRTLSIMRMLYSPRHRRS